MNGLDFSEEGTPVDGVPDFASGGVAVGNAPDFSQGGEPVAADFKSQVMSPLPDLEHSTLLEPWRYVPASAGDGPWEKPVDQEQVRAIQEHFAGLKGLVSPNEPEKLKALEAARQAALKDAGVGVIDFFSKVRLPRAGEASSLPGKVGAGLYNAAAGLVEGIADPEVAGIAAVMPARAVAAFFAADMGSHVPALVRETAEAVSRKDWQKATELAATTAVSGWLTKMLAEHAMGENPAKGLAEELGKAPVTGATKTDRGHGLEARAAAPDFSRAGVEVKTFAPGAGDVRVGAGETITGLDEGKASGMPAEPAVAVTPGAIPETVRSAGPQIDSASTSADPSRKLPQAMERPWDLLDELGASVGKIRGKASARPGSEGYYGETYEATRKLGAARALFSNERGVSPDEAVDALRRSGHLPEDASVDDLWGAMDAAAKARKGLRAGVALEARLAKEEVSQQMDFAKQALKAGPQKDAVAVGDLLEGDELTIAGAKFKVKELAFDPDTTDLTHVVLEDGRRFGVKTVGADQLIHVDKGSLKPVDRAPDFLRPEDLKSGPEFVPAEGGGEQATMGLGVEARSAEELAREKAAAEQRAAIQEGQNRRLVGGAVDSTGDMFDETKADNPLLARGPRGGGAVGDPMDGGAVAASPVLQAPYPPGTPTSTLFNARVPVAMAKTTGRTVTIPEIMRSLENVIQVTGAEAPIRTGRFGHQARGIYKIKPEVIRLKAADNIPTATHEIGHALQKRIFGSALAAGLKGVPGPVKTELRSLGKALYGSTKPVAGYIGEGFAEFMRHYLTTDSLPKVAPNAARWFEGELAKLPDVRKALSDARALVDTYRGMGSVQRARMQLVKRPGGVSRFIQTVKDTFSKKAMVDEFDALYEISKGYEGRAGKKLAAGEDPFLLATWKRGTAGAVVESMVDRGMQDLYGNPTGGMSLRQALAPVKGRAEDFALYLFGRRAMERWGKGKNPGITLEDALHLVQHFDSPEFQLAASNYYEWNRGVLNYLKEANPVMGPTIDAILKVSKDYAPLARVIDPRDASAAASVARSNPLYRMKGSGRQVRDIFETTLENTSRLVSLAHRSMILDAVVKLSHVEGMGFLVERVPRDRVREQVNFEKVRQQLEDMGVDTSSVPQDETLSFFSLAETPRGSDPIVAVKEPGGVGWYHVQPGVFEALNGLEVYRLPGMLNLFLGSPARAFRLGTTGLRAAFSLVTNPLRDVQTFIMQTKSEANPAKLGAAYFGALAEVVRAGLGGKESGHVEAFHRLGAHLAQPLGIDIAHTKRAAKTLFHGKFMRVVTNPVDHLRELLSITEAGPRVAELKLIAERVGWKPGTKMTREQAVEMAVAAKRVTVDFTAGGQIAKVINQAVPFFNASLQGSRSFLRTMRERPGRSVLWGLTALTVPSLYQWWQNKDKEWYRQLPWRERYLYDNIDDGKGNVWQIPRSFEWGNLFQVAPEAILDSWHRQDPRGAAEALKYIFDTTNPADWPVPLKVAKEQWQNRIDFFNRPIVPRNQVELPPGDQRGPYTTKLAQWIGDAFPNTLSPRRIDAAVRGFLGGAVPDLVEALGLGSTGNERDRELSDVPVFGRVFRRGGEFSAGNQAIADFYDDYTRLQARANADAAYRSGHVDKVTSPLTPEEYGYWKVLDAEHVYFKVTADLANRTSNLGARQKLYQEMGREAEAVLKMRPKWVVGQFQSNPTISAKLQT